MRLAVVLLIAQLLQCADAQLDLYCETDNCYDLLGVTRDATEPQIRRSYRKLSLRYHPDKNKTEGAVEMFRKLTRALDVPSNDGSRKR